MNDPPKRIPGGTLWTRIKLKCSIERMSLAVGVAVVILTVMLIIFTRDQVRISRDAVGVADSTLTYQKYRDSINSIEQARMNDSTIAVAKRSAAAAEASIATSKQIAATQKQFAKIETRAYVLIEPDTLGWMVRLNDTTTCVTWTFHNIGKTPAHNVKGRYVTSSRYFSIAEQKAMPVDPVGGFTIGSGTKYPRPELIIGPRRWIDFICSPYGLLIITTKMRYEDVFHIWHTTYRCIRVEGKAIYNMPTPDDD